MESLHQFRRLEVREKARNVFVMSLRLYDHKVLHDIASLSRFLDFARIFSLFSLVFRTSKFLELKEFNETIIPFALVGYETGYSQLGVYYSVPCHIQRALMEYLGTLRSTTTTLTKTSPQNITLHYRNFLAVRSSRSRRTMWVKCPKNKLARSVWE